MNTTDLLQLVKPSPCYVGKLKTEMNLLSGKVVPEGTEISIYLPKKRCDYAIAEIPDHDKLFNISWKMVSKLFPDDFPPLDEEELSEALFDGEISSVRGNTCYEVDGYDTDGWPSITMAYGYC